MVPAIKTVLIVNLSLFFNVPSFIHHYRIEHLCLKGIVHGTTLTVLNAGRLKLGTSDLAGKVFSKIIALLLFFEKSKRPAV